MQRHPIRNLLVVLPLFAALAAAACPYSAAAARGKTPGRVLTVRAVYQLCSRDRAPIGVSHGVVSVRAFYRGIPGAGSGQSGVLFDHEISSERAWQIELVPVPGTDKRTQTVKVAKGALVVLGPTLLGGQSQQHPQSAIPDGSWVIVRGTLYCRHLNQIDPTFAGAKRTPWLSEKSWRPWQKAPTSTTTPTRTATVKRDQPAETLRSRLVLAR